MRILIPFLLISIFVAIMFNNSNAQYALTWTNEQYGPWSAPTEFPPMVIDKYGNSYISGDFRDIYEEDEFVTMKFSSGGGMYWRKVFYAHGKDRAHSNAVDNYGNVYATGTKNMGVSYSDIMTIKYNSNGDTLWVRIFTLSTNSEEQSYSMALDDSLNVYVAGFSRLANAPNSFDYTLIKYDPIGNLKWYRTYDSPYHGDDLANSVRIDNEGFIYVSGTSWGNLMTVKFDGNGNAIWERVFNGADTPDMELDSTGGIYLTARSYYTGGDDFVTLKYSSDGILKWASRYNRFGIYGDLSYSVAIDNKKNVIATGISDIGSGYNMTTVKYDSNGVLQWANTHPGTNSYSNRASSVVTDIKGNVYVAGSNNGYSTVLVYRPNGTLKWDSNTSPNPIGGKAGTIRVNELGSKVYVAGIGYHTFQMSQYTRIPTKSNLKLKLYIEGLYYPLFNQHARTEIVQIYLRSISYPFELVDSAVAILDSIGFIARATFNDLEADNYYVVVNHFQSLETWCKSGGVYINNTNDTTFFDFSTSASQAYGSNLKLKNGKYCIIPGDLSQDGFIDGTDFLIIDNDAYSFSIGRYLLSDLNGDNFTDAQDMVIADNNRSREVIRP